jgi:hypothetical protein
MSREGKRLARVRYISLGLGRLKRQASLWPPLIVLASIDITYQLQACRSAAARAADGAMHTHLLVMLMAI